MSNDIGIIHAVLVFGIMIGALLAWGGWDFIVKLLKRMFHDE